MAIAEHMTGSAETTGADLARLETFIKEHQRMIFTVCYRMTGSVEDAEDLAQETFIQACRSFGTFRGESRVSSWLYRIAVNKCLNWRAGRNRRERLHRELENQQEPEAPTGAAERSQEVQELLMKLDPKQRAAVVLTIYEGLNHSEAARVLGCSETTVSWRLFKARWQLKSLLQSNNREGEEK